MHRSWRVLSYVVIFLAFLLHCAEVCVGTGGIWGMTMVSVAVQPGPEHPGCHSSAAAPQETPNVCTDCAGHVFLTPLPLDTTRLAALGSSLAPFCPKALPLSFSFSEHNMSVFETTRLAPPPRTFTPHVLRL